MKKEFKDLTEAQQESIAIVYLLYFGEKRCARDTDIKTEIVQRKYDTTLYDKAKETNNFKDWNSHIIKGSNIANNKGVKFYDSERVK